MSAESATVAGRQAAEALMTDLCVIHRPTGAYDPVTRDEITHEVYAGKCKVQTYEAHESTPEVGGGAVTVQRYSLHVPVGAYRPDDKDVATILTCHLDEYLVGRRFVVRGRLHKPYLTAYRLPVDDITDYGTVTGVT